MCDTAKHQLLSPKITTRNKNLQPNMDGNQIDKPHQPNYPKVQRTGGVSKCGVGRKFYKQCTNAVEKICLVWREGCIVRIQDGGLGLGAHAYNHSCQHIQSKQNNPIVGESTKMENNSENNSEISLDPKPVLQLSGCQCNKKTIVKKTNRNA